MNTSVWLISFTDSSGKKVQTVHTHNCISDFRMLDPNATVQAIDCAAVAELIETASRAAIAACRGDDFHPGTIRNADLDALRAALANVGSAS